MEVPIINENNNIPLPFYLNYYFSINRPIFNKFYLYLFKIIKNIYIYILINLLLYFEFLDIKKH